VQTTSTSDACEHEASQTASYLLGFLRGLKKAYGTGPGTRTIEQFLHELERMIAQDKAYHALKATD